MMFLLGDLLRQDVHQPEHGDADDRRDDQHYPGDVVGHGVECFAVEEGGLGGGGGEQRGQTGHERNPVSAPDAY